MKITNTIKETQVDNSQSNHAFEFCSKSSRKTNSTDQLDSSQSKKYIIAAIAFIFFISVCLVMLIKPLIDAKLILEPKKPGKNATSELVDSRTDEQIAYYGVCNNKMKNTATRQYSTGAAAVTPLVLRTLI